MLVSILPDRIGHATFLHQSPCKDKASAVETVLKEKIPLGCYHCLFIVNK